MFTLGLKVPCKRDSGRSTFYAHVLCAYLNGFNIRVTTKKESLLKVTA